MRNLFSSAMRRPFTPSVETLMALDRASQLQRSSQFGQQASKAMSTALSIPRKVFNPLLGVPIKTNDPMAYLKAYGPLGAASLVAGGTHYAAPLLGEFANLGNKLNPDLIRSVTAAPDAAGSILSLGKPVSGLISSPWASLANKVGLSDYAGMASALGLGLAPMMLAGLAGRAGYRMYSRAGQARRLAKLKAQYGVV